jgi:hypothetical protein
VRALKIVDFPTLGRPTIPQFNGIVLFPCCAVSQLLAWVRGCFGVVGVLYRIPFLLVPS